MRASGIEEDRGLGDAVMPAAQGNGPDAWPM
jgi:hypothetical protein